jgi:hypothetical protein
LKGGSVMAIRVRVKPKKGQTGSILNVELTASNLVDAVVKETGLPAEIVRRILLFLNFALHTKEGKLTKFAKTFNITDYKSLYEFLKKTKELYKKDHEIEAFSVRYNTMFKSVQPRASAWIFNTFVKYEEGLEDKEKYITANLYASSFTNRTFGQVMENLKLFKNVVKAMDKYTKEIDKFAEGEGYGDVKGED